MKWNNKEEFKLLASYTSSLAHNASRAQKCEDASTKFIGNFKIPAENDKVLVRTFGRMLESKPGSKPSQASFEKWENYLFFEFVPNKQKEKHQGRLSVTLGDSPCLKKARSILKDAISCVEQFATEQKISKETALQNACWQMQSNMAIICWCCEIHQQHYSVTSTFPPTNFKWFGHCALPHNVVLHETASALIKLLNQDVHDGDAYQLVGKFGVDGSGSHKIPQQLINTSIAMTETSHLDQLIHSVILLSPGTAL